jgi:hypothetical protein
VGGGFDRRGNPDSDFVSEPAYIVKAAGKPMKMIWTREDDMQAIYYRPSFLQLKLSRTTFRRQALLMPYLKTGAEK